MLHPCCCELFDERSAPSHASASVQDQKSQKLIAAIRAAQLPKTEFPAAPPHALRPLVVSDEPRGAYMPGRWRLFAVRGSVFR